MKGQKISTLMRRGNWEIVSEERKAKNFPRLMKDIEPQMEKCCPPLSSINMKKMIRNYFIGKLLKNKDILNVARGKYRSLSKV